MNRILLTTLLVLSYLLGFSEYYHGQLHKNRYYFSNDIEKTEIAPFHIRGDSVMIKVLKPELSIDGNNLYVYDVIVDPAFAKKALAFEEKNYDKVLTLDEETAYSIESLCLYTMYINQGLDISSDQDPFRLKAKDFAPRGYIDDWGWSKNSIGYAAPRFKFVNTNSKTIKYITFYVQYENAVGDLVRDYMDGSTTFSYRGIGPIEQFESGSYNWEDDCPYFIKNAATAKVTKVVIEYMDGSKYTLIKELKFNNR